MDDRNEVLGWRGGEQRVLRGHWPRTGRRAVPPTSGARTEAAAFVTRSGVSDPQEIAARLGIVVRFCTLRAASGGLEAALIPDVARPFEILCDRWLPDGCGEERIAFRIAHELAHTLFYDWTQCPPRQLLPPSAREETFCDQFAGVLVAAKTT